MEFAQHPDSLDNHSSNEEIESLNDNKKIPKISFEICDTLNDEENK